MTDTPTPRTAADPARPWQIAVAVLAVLALTLLVINVVLRSRADSARAAQATAEQRTAQLTTENAELRTRNDQLLTQLSTSHERLTGVVDRMRLTKKQLAAADADVAAQVAAQKAAERAVRRADSQAQRARAALAATQAQLRNAQTCSAAAIRALSQIHSGPDIETGAAQAAETLESALPACRAGLR